MFLMYVDESGDVGMTNSPTRYFVLVGLVLHELRWQQTRDELIAFRRDIKQRHGLKLREEIHASALISRPGALARIAKHARLEVLRRHADKLAAMPDLSLVCVVVDKQGKPQTSMFSSERGKHSSSVSKILWRIATSRVRKIQMIEECYSRITLMTKN